MSVKIPQVVADFSVQLATAIAVGATSFSISSNTDSDGNTIPNGLYIFTIDKGSTKKEYLLGTLTGTSVASVSTVNRQGTAASGAARAHRIGATVEITDFALIQRIASTLTGGIDLDSDNPLAYDANPSFSAGSNELATILYVDDAVDGVVAGSFNKLRIAGTAGEDLVAGNLVYLKVADSKWWKCDADTAATVENIVLGIAQGTGSADGAITDGVLVGGIDATQTGLTANSTYYASDTAGAISATPGTVEVTIGVATSTTNIVFSPRYNQQLTEDQQDALAGTSGTPSASNKYVTDDDVAAAATASKVARRNATGDITVPATPAASTDAASKGYVDTNAANTYTVNADTNQQTWYTIQGTLNWDDTANEFSGWTNTNIQTSSGGGGTGWAIIVSVTGNSSITTTLPGTGSAATYDASTDIRIKTRIKWGASGAGDILSFGAVNTASTLYADQTSTASGMRFIKNGTTLYAWTSQGSGVTATDVSGALTLTNWNTYEIVFNPGTDVKFYVNGTLVATHTTNIPDASTTDVQGYGYGIEVAAGVIYTTSPVISIEV